MTARTVACSRATAATLCTWISGEVPELREALDGLKLTEDWVDLVTLSPGIRCGGRARMFRCSRVRSKMA